MAEYLIKEETLINIANAIRTVSGTSESVSVTNIPTMIGSISSGGSVNLDAEITEQEEKIADQDTIIANLMTALEGKAAGSGSNGCKTCTVEHVNDDSLIIAVYCNVISNNEVLPNESYSASFSSISSFTIENVLCGSIIVVEGNTNAISAAVDGVELTKLYTGQNMMMYQAPSESGACVYIG